MGRKPASYQETNTDPTSRARDNKRRHRARQKEYVSDLEHRVAVAHEQGLQATKEVQLAAQRVTRENAKLRDLLRRTGYTEDAIDAWVREDGCLHGAERPQLVIKPLPEKGVQKVASVCESQRERKLGPQNANAMEGESVPMKISESGEGSAEASIPVKLGSKISPTQVSAAIFKTSSPPPQHPDSAGAPCKLVTLLAKNPAADITQVPLPTESVIQSCQTSKPEDCNIDGIECSTAYNMLMHYATSGERMDRIAAALESGCTPSAAGGCKVKKSVVWRTLDEECT